MDKIIHFIQSTVYSETSKKKRKKEKSIKTNRHKNKN